MSYQQVYFNFGQAPFKYPPKKLKFTDFNSNAIVDNKDSIKIVPMYVCSRLISESLMPNFFLPFFCLTLFPLCTKIDMYRAGQFRLAIEKTCATFAVIAWRMFVLNPVIMRSVH